MVIPNAETTLRELEDMLWGDWRETQDNPGQHGTRNLRIDMTDVGNIRVWFKTACGCFLSGSGTNLHEAIAMLLDAYHRHIN